MKLIDRVVERANGVDTVALVPVVADALAVGRLGAWLVPAAAARAGALRRYAQLVLTHGLAHGQVETTADRAAVAVWYPRLASSAPSAVSTSCLRSVLGRHAARFVLLHEYVNAVVPHTPYHYLAHVAARPGRGAAVRALLSSYHRVVEADGLPSYAEVCSDRPRDGLLAGLGYQPRSPVLLEPGGPALWRMWRPTPGSEPPGELPRRVRLHRTATPFRDLVLPATPPRSP